MSLREDMETLDLHIKNGTGREYLLGTAKPAPAPPAPIDPRPASGFYAQMIQRGD